MGLWLVGLAFGVNGVCILICFMFASNQTSYWSTIRSKMWNYFESGVLREEADYPIYRKYLDELQIAQTRKLEFAQFELNYLKLLPQTRKVLHIQEQ